MWKSKKFKVIAVTLILSITSLLMYSSNFKVGVKELSRVFQYSKMIDSEGYDVTELGQLQNNILESHKLAQQGVENKDIELCKEAFSEIVKNIEEADEKVSEEFAKAENIVKELDYEEGQERLEEIKNSYEKLANKKESIEEVIACNDIDKFALLLEDKELFEIEESEDLVLSNDLPNSQYNGEAEVVEEENINRSYVETYPSDKTIEKEEEYLKETIDTAFSKEIIEKSKEIGGNPLDLYNFVRNNIVYEPYSGSRKGATGTLLESYGNDYDQSSLLIALFRNNNIPARYVRGTIELSNEQAMKWTNTNNVEAAAKILSSCGNKTISIVNGGKIVAIQVEHVWVEAYCDKNEYRGAGESTERKEWIPFDPSYKECVEVEGMDFTSYSAVDKNKIDSLKEESDNFTDINPSSLESIFTDMNNKVENINKADLEGKSVFEIFGGLDIQKEELDILPYSIPNKLINVESRFAEIEEKNRDYVEFSLSDLYGIDGSLNYKASAVELYGKKITLSWEAATEKDKEIIKEYGDMFNTPAYLIKVKPVIKVDGEIVAEGTAIGFGKSQLFNLSMNRVSISKETYKNQLVAGGYYAVALDYGHISQGELLDIQEKTEEAKKNIDKLGYYNDEVAGNLLNGIVKNYFSQVDGIDRMLAKDYNVRSTRLLSFGMTGTSLKTSSLFSSPVDVKLSSFYIDIDGNNIAAVNKDNDEDTLFKYITQSGVMASSLESQVFKDLFGMEAVSTIEIMNLCNEKDIPIYVINKENIESLLPKLELSNVVKTEVINAVNSGKTVTIPEKEISYFDWEGTGYIVQDMETGSAGYMISGGHAGGSVATDLSSVDWGEVFEYFLAGLLSGIGIGILFSIIGIIGTFFFPELAIILAAIAIISLIGLIINIIGLIIDYCQGEVDLQTYYNQLAFILGSLIGAWLGGKITESAIKPKIESTLRNSVNKKYNISEELGESIYKNSGSKNYNRTAKNVDKLLQRGMPESQISESLNKLNPNAFENFTNAVSDYLSQSGKSSLSAKQLELLNGYAERGKSPSELIKIAKAVDEWFDANGEPKWPPNDGAVEGTISETTINDIVIDRFGNEYGKYVAPEGASYTSRSLAPGTDLGPYHRYKVVEPITVEQGVVAPWFGEEGGAIQYKLPKSITELIAEGKIIRLE